MANIGYTVNEINRRLDLINENRNFLEYPYNGIFPDDLIDVGDGSILTLASSTNRSSYMDLELSVPALDPGTYVHNLAVTTILEEPVDHEFSLILTGSNFTPGNDNTFTANDQAIVAVHLRIPRSFSADLLIKPQIIKVDDDPDVWTPYMDNVGDYVDRRFNGTNAKIRVINNELDSINGELASINGELDAIPELTAGSITHGKAAAEKIEITDAGAINITIDAYSTNYIDNMTAALTGILGPNGSTVADAAANASSAVERLDIAEPKIDNLIQIVDGYTDTGAIKDAVDAAQDTANATASKLDMLHPNDTTITLGATSLTEENLRMLWTLINCIEFE